MARNSIAANLLMFLLLGGGIWSAATIQKEVFPQFQLDVVEVNVGYPGAAPSEVEQGILRPIEGAVRGVEGIREITSEAREGRGEVLIEIVAGQQRMKVFQDIDQAISRIRTFPEQIEQPEVRLQSEQREAMQVALYGPVDVWTLRKLAEQLRDTLQAHDQITQVELRRVPQYVTHVEIPRQRLREYGLTLPDVAEIIRTSSQDAAIGHPGRYCLDSRWIRGSRFSLAIQSNAIGRTGYLPGRFAVSHGHCGRRRANHECL